MKNDTIGPANHADKSLEQYQNLLDIRMREAQLAFLLECFGDNLAKKKGYKSHSGIDAIWFYLVEKNHWLPSQVKGMSWDDLRFCMDEEMSGWQPPDVTGGLTSLPF